MAVYIDFWCIDGRIIICDNQVRRTHLQVNFHAFRTSICGLYRICELYFCELALAKFNKYLGWSLLTLTVLTYAGFIIFSNQLGAWKFEILLFIFLIISPFGVTAFLGTRDAVAYPKSRNIAIKLGRFYVLVAAVIVPAVADWHFLYVSIIGSLVLLASYYFKTYKELQLLIINCLGLLIVGLFALTGMLAT